MNIQDFNGAKKYTFVFQDGSFYVLTPDKITSGDGIDLPMGDNNITISTAAYDIDQLTTPTIGSGSLGVSLKNWAEVGKLFPKGFNPTTGTWAPAGSSACQTPLMYLVQENVCDQNDMLVIAEPTISPNFEVQQDVGDPTEFSLAIFFSWQSRLTAYQDEGADPQDYEPYVAGAGSFDPSTHTITWLNSPSA